MESVGGAKQAVMQKQALIYITACVAPEASSSEAVLIHTITS